MSASVNLAGRLTDDPQLKFSAKGTAVATFTVVTARRYLDKADNSWKETETSFWNVVAFGQLAENVCESLEKGTSVIVNGRAYQEKWQTKEGENRYSWKVTAEDIAPSMRWTQVSVRKTDRAHAQPGGPSQSEYDEPPF